MTIPADLQSSSVDVPREAPRYGPPSKWKPGDTVALLTLLYRARSNKRGKAIWRCRCSCGNETEVDVDNLGRGTKSCGHLKRQYHGPGPSPLLDRLNLRTVIDLETGCWLWTGADNGSGYGEIWDQEEGRAVGTHIAGWKTRHGSVPAGLQVLHHCDTPRCWNPYHLFSGTQAANIADMLAKGRHHGQTRTVCKRGHVLGPETTVEVPRRGRSPYRRCRECMRLTNREGQRRYKAKRKAGAVT